MQIDSNLEEKIRISMERFESSIQASNRKHAQEKDSNPQDEIFESLSEEVGIRPRDLNPP